MKEPYYYSTGFPPSLFFLNPRKACLHLTKDKAEVKKHKVERVKSEFLTSWVSVLHSGAIPMVTGERTLSGVGVATTGAPGIPAVWKSTLKCPVCLLLHLHRCFYHDMICCVVATNVFDPSTSGCRKTSSTLANTYILIPASGCERTQGERKLTAAALTALSSESQVALRPCFPCR